MEQIQKIVEQMLISYPETRDSDTDLYIRICEQMNPIACNMPFTEVLKKRAMYGLPNIESVGRARRKLQEHRPEYRASRPAEDARYEKWKEVRRYVQAEI